MTIGDTKRARQCRAGIKHARSLGLIAIIAIFTAPTSHAAPLSEGAGGLRAERSRRERLVQKRSEGRERVTASRNVITVRSTPKPQRQREVVFTKAKRTTASKSAVKPRIVAARTRLVAARPAKKTTPRLDDAPKVVAQTSRSPKSSAVTFTRRIAGGVSVQVVSVDLTRPGVRVTPVLARRGVGADESLGAMMSRTAPTAAITGTFFDTRSRLPVGDIVIGGDLVHFGGRGAGLCITAGGRGKGVRAIMRSNAGQDRHTNWRQSDSVMSGGMWLVRNGAVALNPRAQGFHDPSLFKPNPRVAVGLAGPGRLLLVATTSRVTLAQWAGALDALGATDALNLDGGSSTGMHYRGQTVIRPGRRLTNALAVFEETGPEVRTERISRAAPAPVRGRAGLAPPPRWEGPVASRGDDKPASRATRSARRNGEGDSASVSAKRTRSARDSRSRVTVKRVAPKRRGGSAPVIVASNGAHLGRN